MKETDPNLIRLVSDMTGEDHLPIENMSAIEKENDLKIVVNEVMYRGEYCFILRAFSNHSKSWYIEEIEREQATAIIMQQQMNALLRLFGGDAAGAEDETKDNMFKIFDLDQNPDHRKNMEQIYEMKKNDGDFKEDELVSEDEFKRMMEGD